MSRPSRLLRAFLASATLVALLLVASSPASAQGISVPDQDVGQDLGEGGTIGTLEPVHVIDETRVYAPCRHIPTDEVCYKDHVVDAGPVQIVPPLEPVPIATVPGQDTGWTCGTLPLGACVDHQTDPWTVGIPRHGGTSFDPPAWGPPAICNGDGFWWGLPWNHDFVGPCSFAYHNTNCGDDWSCFWVLAPGGSSTPSHGGLPGPAAGAGMETHGVAADPGVQPGEPMPPIGSPPVTVCNNGQCPTYTADPSAGGAVTVSYDAEYLGIGQSGSQTGAIPS